MTSQVKFKQMYPSMFGGFFALDEQGQVWQFDRYNNWHRVKSPDREKTPFLESLPPPITEDKSYGQQSA